MRKIICTLVLTSLIFSSVTAQDTPDSTTIDTDSLLNFGMEMILNKMLLTRDDFTFRDDYTPKDPYRLKIVDSLMTRPILMADFTEEFADVMREFGENPDFGISQLQGLFGDGKIVHPDRRLWSFGTYIQSAQIRSRNSHQSDGPWLDPWGFRECTQSDRKTDLKIRGDAGTYLDQINRAGYCFGDLFYLKAIIEGKKSFSKKKDVAQYKLWDELIYYITDIYPELILDDPDYRKWTNEQLDSIQNIEEDWAVEFAKKGKELVSAKLPEEGLAYFDTLIKSFRPMITDDLRKDVYRKTKNYKFKKYPLIAIGTEGNDTYEGEYILIIDPGGDDTYNLSYDIDSPHPCVIVDFEGNDIYNAMTDYALACGALDFSLLIDYEGDDIYQARNFGLGAGYFGVGILWDKKGNDKYFGDTFVQGAGTFGYGLLIDEEGSDTYTANLQSQGFGFVKGIGGIADYDGNDSYIIQPKYKEYFHEGNHYASLSQGFSIGVRPHMSGGFGFICDYGGNDFYLADFFAQASSYWWSLGMIYDKAGNDLYSTYQYAQGAGAHMALGMLMDCDGDDVYRSHGVCQGCGHDYSCGWLLDKGGHDVYTSQGLAQGAGQANGIGIFNDLGGDDGYYTHMKHNTQGYGNPRRDYGSIGIFLDMAGDDRYQGNGGNDTYWKVPGKWGMGIDWEPPKPDTATAGEGE